ncbi:MAG TPA: aldolase/citrate lyase family protein [Azoarcus taiwanensis]|nr:aldolase/citrate lyase family protein [Azoarcus taiwanensis]
MSGLKRPDEVLFEGEAPFPALTAVDHYAGSEKLIRKALALQNDMGPVFDITCDCEDGAPTGAESEHAQMVASLILDDDNRFGRVGVRIHDITHPHWVDDLELLVPRAGERIAFVTLPKVRSAKDACLQIDTLRKIEATAGQSRPLPVHVLIETHGALREVWDIAALAGVESIDFGLMDFVSAHHGAIGADAMRSPGQFTHPLVVRAKCEIAAAALANGVVPSHNVTTELRDLEVIRSDARRARREFGFMRMWSIHPNQIRPIIEVMQPDFAEVQDATEILLAAQAANWGPIRHRETLHDRASYRYYWELLRRARATGVDAPPEASNLFGPTN